MKIACMFTRYILYDIKVGKEVAGYTTSEEWIALLYRRRFAVADRMVQKV
jgi:hypothetical protein